MEFIAAKCPNCAGDLRLPDNKDQVICMYCGFDILVREAISATQPSVENLKKLAFTSEAEDNDQEAYEYFKRILEYEPDSLDALVGKAIAAENLYSYNLKTYKNEGPPPILSSVRRRIESLPTDQQEEAKTEIARRLVKRCPRAVSFAAELAPNLPEVIDLQANLERFRREQTEKDINERAGERNRTLFFGLVGAVIVVIVGIICCGGGR